MGIGVEGANSAMMEVALLEWGGGAGGVRLLGRSTDPEIVAAVREHLASKLLPTAAESINRLRVVRSGPSMVDRTRGPGHTRGDRDA